MLWEINGSATAKKIFGFSYLFFTMISAVHMPTPRAFPQINFVAHNFTFHK